MLDAGGRADAGADTGDGVERNDRALRGLAAATAATAATVGRRSGRGGADADDGVVDVAAALGSGRSGGDAQAQYGESGGDRARCEVHRVPPSSVQVEGENRRPAVRNSIGPWS